MLLVLNAPNGPDRYQALVPQSITLVGYWPFSGRLGLLRLLKSTVRGWFCGGDVGIGVDVGIGAGPALLITTLSKLVSQPLLLPSVTLEHVPPQPVTMVNRPCTARLVVTVD